MKKALPICVALLVVSFMAAQSLMPPPVISQAPEVQLSEIDGYTSVPLDPSQAELETLPSDTVILKRRYQGSGAETYVVSAVIGGKGKSSIHRPELCLPAQGFLMSNPHSVSLNDIPWRRLGLERGAGEESFSFAYTFFNQAGMRTSSHVRRIFADVWDRSVLGRIDRWVMVTVFSLSNKSDEMEGFLSKLSETLR